MKFLTLIIFLIFFNTYCYSNDLFETSFHDIQFTSKNIENTKIIEIKKLKKQSILEIFNNTLNSSDYNKINKNITEDLINTFITNIIINDEKIINDKYFSKIKINFSKKKIIKYFRDNKFSYVDYYPDKFLLIIYEINGINNKLFSNKNIYYKYFIDNLKNNDFFNIPNLDINDRFILKEEHLINRELDKINNFIKKYKSKENVIVIVEKNNNQLNFDLVLYSDGKILEKKLEFKKNELDLFYKFLEDETMNLWKQINQIQNVLLNRLSCKVKYFTMLELKEIRNNLNNISLIKNINIKTLSLKNIEYDIYFYGTLKILLKTLELNKLKINLYENQCIIKLR